jgi:hypothetical protein
MSSVVAVRSSQHTRRAHADVPNALESVARGDKALRVGEGGPDVVALQRLLGTYLSPWAGSTTGDVPNGDETHVVIVEEMPASVHLADLFQTMRRVGQPPLGLALRVVHAMAHAITRVKEAGLAHDITLTRHPANVLLRWDGDVVIQPRAQAWPPEMGVPSQAVPDLAKILLRLVGGSIRGDLPIGPRLLLTRCIEDVERRPTLEVFMDAVARFAREEGFTAEHQAGVLAQLFPEQRKLDLELREELAMSRLQDRDTVRIHMRSVELSSVSG